VRRPQPHVAGDPGSIAFPDPLPSPVARSAEIFLKIVQRWSFAKTSE
jgi:hypothetical protein